LIRREPGNHELPPIPGAASSRPLALVAELRELKCLQPLPVQRFRLRVPVRAVAGHVSSAPIILDIELRSNVGYRRADVSPYRSSAPLTSTWNNFDFDVSDGVATVTFNRPDKLNALTFDTYADLRDLIQQLPQREDVKVLTITGQGKGFCSGGDVEEIIGELLKLETAELLEFTRMTGAVVKSLREVPLPVIAAVNGTAAGAGTVIALAADLRILATSASFAFLFTRVGLSGADMGSAYLLPRIVGLGRATELLMLGDRIDAKRAYEIGLASDVVDTDELTTTTANLSRRLAQGPAFAYATTKSLLTRELDMGLGAAIELEAITQALLMHGEDFAEFYNAWTEGRKPDWKGR
jgi:enoyl-CoA hydratase/carnithine racemase